jgi:hypothetical protein
MVEAMPFWLSIACLSLLQGAIVLLPVVVRWAPLARLRAGGWAAVLPLSVLGFVLIARAAEHASAQGLTYLALVAVPLLAAFALGWSSRGARPSLALVAVALFALAWADRGGLAGEGAAALLSALSCVALGSLLGAITPARWLAVGIVAMAMIDTSLVVSDLLQRPNDALNAAHPVAHLPQLQSAVFGSAVIGYGDLFVAGVFGGMVAAQGRSRAAAAALTTAFALCFDLLFFFVDELPATVPVAVAMLVLALSRRRRSAADPRAAREARPASSRHPGGTLLPPEGHAQLAPDPRAPRPS